MTSIGSDSVRSEVTGTGPHPWRVALAWASLSDVGLRREVNEDSVVTALPVFAVADGMGGHAAGDVASRVVVTRLGDLARDTTSDPAHVYEQLRLAVEDMVTETAITDGNTGTTLTGIVLGEAEGRPTWFCVNIGDSRVYLLENGTLRQITEDHSVVQHLINQGAISPAEAEDHPHANVITRAVGPGDDPYPDVFVVPVASGQRFLICSDGLTKELTDLGIAHFLASGQSPAEAAETLLRESLGNSGRDNITVAVVDVLEVSAGEDGGAEDAGDSDTAPISGTAR